jgi:hypothetical protein
MKVYGDRILNSNFRFAFEVEGDELSTADRMFIERVNDAVADSLAGDASLEFVVHRLAPLIEGGATVTIEPICNE